MFAKVAQSVNRTYGVQTTHDLVCTSGLKNMAVEYKMSVTLTWNGYKKLCFWCHIGRLINIWRAFISSLSPCSDSAVRQSYTHRASDFITNQHSHSSSPSPLASRHHLPCLIHAATTPAPLRAEHATARGSRTAVRRSHLKTKRSKCQGSIMSEH